MEFLETTKHKLHLIGIYPKLKLTLSNTITTTKGVLVHQVISLDVE
jgi:hypothetical protein